MIYYLGIFATPGGDKHHLFSLELGADRISGTITNSMGPVELTNCALKDNGFSADMPAGMGLHHFDAEFTENGIHVCGTVIMEGKPVGTYEADMAQVADATLPADPPGPSGPPPMPAQ